MTAQKNKKIDWCSFHNLPMSRCNKTSSMCCESIMVPYIMAIDIASDKDYIAKELRGIERGLVKEVKGQEEA